MTSTVSNKTCDHCNGYGNCPYGFSDSTICLRCDLNGRKSITGSCRQCRGRGRVQAAPAHRASTFPGLTWQAPAGVDLLPPSQPQPMATVGCWTVQPGGYGPGLV